MKQLINSKPHVQYIQYDVLVHVHYITLWIWTIHSCLYYCRLRVTKEGPNKDREFYSCSLPRGQGCDFFQWADATGIVGWLYFTIYQLETA